MKTSPQLKWNAKLAMRGRMGVLISGLLLTGLISFAPMILDIFYLNPDGTVGNPMNTAISYLFSLLASLFTMGYAKLCLNISRNQTYGLKDLLFVFKNNPDRFIIVQLILLALQFALELPFTYMTWSGQVSPDNVTFFMIESLFSLVIVLLLDLFLFPATYLLLDNPEMGAIESLKTSCKLMKKNKGRLIYINISFFPLIFFTIFTLYIGLLWVMPYMHMTLALFYRDLIHDENAPEPTVETFSNTQY